MGEVLENVGAFLETLGNPPNSTRTLLPLSPKNRKEESLPSTFFISSREKPSVILPPNYLISVLDFPFSTSIPLTSAKKHA